jgi:Na+-translocating ferredoxin:NAD+ oxidoreductase RnfC subunit
VPVEALERLWTREEAVSLLRRAGIVGAGGAGFPTYVKYQTSASLLIANGMESEPGFYADKLLLQRYPEEFATLFRALKEIFDLREIILAVKEKHRGYVSGLEGLSHSNSFEIRYLEDTYGLGVEKALIRKLTGTRVPQGKYPPDLGIVVNNVETLYNIYRALFETRPVTTKFLTVFGELAGPQVYEAPLGAYAHDLLELAGVDLSAPELRLIDGGPLMGKVVDLKGYAIKKTSNGLLLVREDLLQAKAQVYPKPTTPPVEIVNVEGKIHRVNLDLRPYPGAPAARPLVQRGQRVEKGEMVAEPGEELTVAVHASITGIVKGIGEDWISIEA